jgi:hypothetical protein
MPLSSTAIEPVGFTCQSFSWHIRRASFEHLDELTLGLKAGE